MLNSDQEYYLSVQQRTDLPHRWKRSRFQRSPYQAISSMSPALSSASSILSPFALHPGRQGASEAAFRKDFTMDWTNRDDVMANIDQWCKQGRYGVIAIGRNGTILKIKAAYKLFEQQTWVHFDDPQCRGSYNHRRGLQMGRAGISSAQGLTSSKCQCDSSCGVS